MLDSVKNEVTRTLMLVQIQQPEALQEAIDLHSPVEEGGIQVTYTAPNEQGEAETVSDEPLEELPQEAFVGVNRNDPCPCGSGKRYKHCHGQLK